MIGHGTIVCKGYVIARDTSDPPWIPETSPSSSMFPLVPKPTPIKLGHLSHEHNSYSLVILVRPCSNMIAFKCRHHFATSFPEQNQIFSSYRYVSKELVKVGKLSIKQKKKPYHRSLDFPVYFFAVCKLPTLPIFMRVTYQFFSYQITK